METSIQDCMKIISEARERAPNDPSSHSKEKKTGGEGRSQAWWPMEGSMLGGQWKVPCLVANGMFQAWWPMEGSKLGGQWMVKEKHPFTSSIFPPTTFTQTFNFYFDLTVLLYHGPKPLITPSFSFSSIYKL
jgi:hypothetical protein